MKNKAQMIITIVFIVAIAILSAIAFWLLDETAYFWVTYAFTLAAAILLFVVLMYYMGDGKRTMREFPANAPYAYIAIQYAAFEIVLAAAFCIIGLSGLSIIYFICAELVLALIYGIRIVIAFGAKQVVVGSENATQARVQDWQTLTADVQAIQQKTDRIPSGQRMSVEKALHRLYDAIRYSDPMSSESVSVIERQIREGISSIDSEFDRLMNVQDADTVVVLMDIDKVERLIEDRNSRIKISK